jgi:hypothetical protein
MSGAEKLRSLRPNNLISGKEVLLPRSLENVHDAWQAHSWCLGVASVPRFLPHYSLRVSRARFVLSRYASVRLLQQESA